MTEKQRFDPIGWFVSACFALFAGVAALAAAVHLLQSIWLSLALLLGGATLVAAMVLAVLWWHRRQPW